MCVHLLLLLVVEATTTVGSMEEHNSLCPLVVVQLVSVARNMTKATKTGAVPIVSVQ